MYPELVRFGDFQITSFGVMVAIGALTGLWVFGRELRRSGLPERAADAGIWGVLGGLAGAKALWTLEHVGDEPMLALLLSRGGLSWYGGLAGGIGVGLLVIAWQRVSLIPVLAAATPALAVGHLLGRIGCFLVGDDYGTPSDLPWAVAFPRGLPPTTVPVHPTQLYEAAVLAVLTWALIRWRRARVADRMVLGRYLVFAGTTRFLIEFIRVNPPVALGLTVAQLASAALAAVGVALLIRQ